MSKLIFTVLVLLALVCPSQRAQAASTHIAFGSDADWSSWVQKDVTLVGSNGGIKLKQTSGHYESTGSLIYKVTPDGLATWGVMSQTQSAPSGTSISFSFSSSEMSIEQSYTDTRARADVKSNPIDVGSSDLLYIRIDLFTNVAGGIATPTLTSFGLDYTVLKTPSVYAEKHIYRYRAADPTPRVETATFVPGDMVVVKTKLSATNAANMTFKVEDTLSRAPQTFFSYTTKSADAIKYCGLSTGDVLFGNSYTYTAGADTLTVDGIVLDGVSGYLCYSYFILTPDPAANRAKNDVQQVRLSVSTGDLIFATSNNYLMVRGLAYKQSDTGRQFATGADFIKIDDMLLFSFDKFIFKGLSGQDVSYASAPSYIYKRGLKANSRGGSFYDLPVTITDSSGVAQLSSDSFYLLYNPSVYVMGNLFSKNSLPDASLDFGSRNNVVSGTTFDGASKLNAQAGLYNYSIDESSVSYWNSTAGQPKSKAMQANIDRIIGTPGHRPENFCDKGSDTSSLANGKLLYLNNENCQINIAGTSNLWPDGRVWYFTPSGDVDLSATVKFSGTMVFDFSLSRNANVRIGTVGTDFAADANGEKSLGIILINGGNVVFTKTADTFNGMVFVPGK